MGDFQFFQKNNVTQMTQEDETSALNYSGGQEHNLIHSSWLLKHTINQILHIQYHYLW